MWKGRYNVSFSGLKTAVINEVHNAEQRGEPVNVADMAASFQERIDQILAKKLLAAAADTGAPDHLPGGRRGGQRAAAPAGERWCPETGRQDLPAGTEILRRQRRHDRGAGLLRIPGRANLADWTLNGLPTLAINYR